MHSQTDIYYFRGIPWAFHRRDVISKFCSKSEHLYAYILALHGHFINTNIYRLGISEIL